MKVFGNPKVLINKEDKVIQITLKSNLDKIVFFDSRLFDWNIYFKTEEDIKSIINESRIDEYLLTGSLTINNSKLNNLNIYFDNGVHEDSLNIIKSSGSINHIFVRNSFQDAIDLDFSNLYIKKIEVEK